MVLLAFSIFSQFELQWAYHRGNNTGGLWSRYDLIAVDSCRERCAGGQKLLYYSSVWLTSRGARDKGEGEEEGVVGEII